VHARDSTFGLPPGTRVHTSFLQHVPFLRREPRLALALLPLAWRLFRPIDHATVICSSSGWSHRLRVGSSGTKIVYCHNPARWLYQSSDYLRERNWAIRAMVALARPAMMHYDKRAARDADSYIANSTAVAERIRKAYGIEPTVIHPPVTIDANGQQQIVDLPFEGFFLSVGRGRGYKNTHRLVEAFARMPDQHLVVVGTEMDAALPPNVVVLPLVTDEELRWLYDNARALTTVAYEDFGLTPLEANVFGTPALVLRAGGFLDSMSEGVSGQYIEDESVDSIVLALRRFPLEWDREAVRAHGARFSMDEFLRRLSTVILETERTVKHLSQPPVQRRASPVGSFAR
jgi:glycosyltransferase involved in cell wall biosynthesis